MNSVTNSEIQTAMDSLVIIPQSIANIMSVDDIYLNFTQNINFTIDVEGTFSDTLIAQTLNQDHIPVSGVPVQFSLAEDIGYISEGEVYTDAQGFAATVYNIYGADILENGGNETTINITAYVDDDNNVTIDRTYQINPTQLISTIELDLNPEILIYNDLPGFDSSDIDSISMSVYVKDDAGVGVSDIPVTFINHTTNYGVIPVSVISTDDFGSALNQLANINTSSFDYLNNTTDTIRLSVEAPGINTVFTDEKYAVIVPQSLQNIWQVDDLDIYFANDLTIIDDITVPFVDTIVAQVIDENSNPVEGVPMSVELSSNNIGYICKRY